MEGTVIGEKRRLRATNFTPAEVRWLMEVVCKYRHIIENKKTDAITNKKKEIAWKKIADSFNVCSGVTSRSAKTIKLKYEGLKKATKKKAALNRQELYKTGGGLVTNVSLSDAEHKVLAICSNIDGLDARNDSVAIIPADLPVANKDDIGLYDCKPIIYGANNASLNLEDDMVVETPQSTDATAYIVDTECTPMINVNEDCDNKITHSTQWKTWTPRALKTRVRKVLESSVSKGSASSKFDRLSEARLEVVALQKEIAKQELQNKITEQKYMREEHELRMLHLLKEEKRKQEEHELKMQQYVT